MSGGPCCVNLIKAGFQLFLHNALHVRIELGSQRFKFSIVREVLYWNIKVLQSRNFGHRVQDDQLFIFHFLFDSQIVGKNSFEDAQVRDSRLWEGKVSGLGPSAVRTDWAIALTACVPVSEFPRFG